MTQLQTKPDSTLASFAQLTKQVQATLFRARDEIEGVKVRAYWETGRAVNEHLRLNGERANYGTRAVEKLSVFVKQSESVLWKCAQFAEKFPDFKILATWTELGPKARQMGKNSVSTPLSWSHFRALLSVEDPRRRSQLAHFAFQSGWSVDELEARISQGAQKKISGGTSSRETSLKKARSLSLKPRTGKIFTAKIVTALEAGLPDRTGRVLDLGFRIYRKLEDAVSTRFLAGEIVEIGGDTIQKSARLAADLFFYRAWVERVIDGDTLWAAIDLGFSNIARQKLRLRGIDAPEIALASGKKSARFLKDLLPAGLEIRIRTLPAQTYDRFQADLFLPATPEACRTLERSQPAGAVSARMNLEGRDYFFVNTLLLERRLAVRI